MRTIAVVLCCLLLESRGFAQTAPTPQERYEHEKKSAALALTLEALCPFAGAGALYARDTDKAAVLGILSVVALGAAAGSVFALVHLDNERGSVVDHAFADVERTGAVTLLVTAAVSYVVLRISGLALAPQALSSYNLKLRDQLGVPPDVPFPSQASGSTLTLPF